MNTLCLSWGTTCVSFSQRVGSVGLGRSSPELTRMFWPEWLSNSGLRLATSNLTSNSHVGLVRGHRGFCEPSYDPVRHFRPGRTPPRVKKLFMIVATVRYCDFSHIFDCIHLLRAWSQMGRSFVKLALSEIKSSQGERVTLVHLELTVEKSWKAELLTAKWIFTPN